MSQLEKEQKNDLDVVQRVVRARETQKVLGDPANPVVFDSEYANGCDEAVLAAARDAGWAPFHYDRGVDDIREPWRATFLNHESCRTVMKHLEQWVQAETAVGKLPAMFAACGSAVVVTWVPQFRGDAEVDAKQGQRVDDEHLAAAAAMVQNMLLLLTAAGFGTYWSSGGAALRDPAVLARLGIGDNESLLALVFVDYPESQATDLKRVPGKHRNKRSEAWLRQVNLVSE